MFLQPNKKERVSVSFTKIDPFGKCEQIQNEMQPAGYSSKININLNSLSYLFILEK